MTCAAPLRQRAQVPDALGVIDYTGTVKVNSSLLSAIVAGVLPGALIAWAMAAQLASVPIFILARR